MYNNETKTKKKSTIKLKQEKHHYTECGLDNIYLRNGWSIDEEGSLFIENIQGLHKAIALQLVTLKRTLKGREIRFIRHYLDLSQKMLGSMLGSDYQSVLRWEKGKGKITKPADRLLKIFTYEYASENKKAVDLIDLISDLDNERDVTDFAFEHDKNWESLKAA